MSEALLKLMLQESQIDAKCPHVDASTIQSLCLKILRSWYLNDSKIDAKVNPKVVTTTSQRSANEVNHCRNDPIDQSIDLGTVADLPQAVGYFLTLLYNITNYHIVSYIILILSYLREFVKLASSWPPARWKWGFWQHLVTPLPWGARIVTKS